MRSLVIGLVAILALGCGRPLEADLLELRSASPDRISPGHRLSIEGLGFPAGRIAHVRLEGSLHRPGHPPRAIDVELEGNAVGTERVEVAMPESTLRRLGGRGTFRGAVRVSFGAGVLDGRVVGHLAPVVIDLVPGDAAPAVVGPPLATRLGLEIEASEDDAAPGVIVARVVPGSRGAVAGLAEQDRIISIDGLRLLSPEELVLAPGAREIDLEVARDGRLSSFSLAIDLGGLDQTVPAERIAVGQLAALTWLLALLLLGPGAMLVERLAPSTARRLPWVLAIVAGIGAVGLRKAMELAPAIGLEAVLLAAIAGRGAVGVLAAEEGRGRGAAIARGVASAIFGAAVVGAATIGIGTTAPLALEAAQGPWPFEWSALRSPVGPLAAVLLVITAACGPRIADRAHARARLVDDGFLVLIATCGVIALAGGASAATRIADLRPGLAGLGQVPFAITTALVAIVLRRARDRGAKAPTASLIALGLALASLTVLAAFGWIELEVPLEIERAIAEVLVLAAIVVALRVATARPPTPARPLHALL